MWAWLLVALAWGEEPQVPAGENSVVGPGEYTFVVPPGRGEALAGLGGCAACHTADGGPPMAGGHAIETDLGTFYGTNLTPDPEFGIGNWSYEDFERAMREGRDPHGRAYYPAFPYPSFTVLTDWDLQALWVWLSSLEPVAQPNRPHDLKPMARGRWKLGLWRAQGFRDGRRWDGDPDQSDAWNVGAYYVRGIGHCGDCHTPRNGIGVPKRRKAMAGYSGKPFGAPNLTPHADGLGDWSIGDITTYLEMGMTPDGDFAGGEMARVIEEGTSKLSDDEREAIAVYLKSLRPWSDDQR